MPIPLLACLMIAAADGPLPDPAALLKEVQSHQEEMEHIRENYTFHRIRRTEELDSKDKVVKTSEEEREFFFVNGRGIGTLLKKNGVALNPSEAKSEQARVHKLVENALKEGPRKRRNGPVGMVSQILDMVKISNPRRVTWNGRPTLAYDFTGDRDAKAHSTEQSAAKKMAGTIWFDEADRQVAKLEVHFLDSFRIGGLLASVQKGTSIAIEQAPVGEGLWMQTSNDQHVSARIVVKGYRENVHMRNFDFKRFDVQVMEKIAAPK